MSVIHGKGGKVRCSNMTHLHAYVHDWTVDITGDVGETTAFSLASPWARTYVAGLTGWTMSFTGRFDAVSGASIQHSDVGTQDQFELSASDASGNKVYYSGHGFITSLSPSLSVDDVASLSIDIQGTGNLTIGNTAAW